MESVTATEAKDRFEQLLDEAQRQPIAIRASNLVSSVENCLNKARAKPFVFAG